MDAPSHKLVYGGAETERLRRLAHLQPGVVEAGSWRSQRDLLREAEYVFSGWGIARFDEELLASMPKLQGVFYAAGSVRHFTTEAFWRRDIVLCSAYAANALPVAEYTLGSILLGLRHFFPQAVAAKRGEGWGDHTRPLPGSFRATVGLVSFGMIARRVAELLRSFDVRVLVYCPFLAAGSAVEAGVERVSLEELFSECDVVSVHTPLLPETRGLVDGALVAKLRPGATLINTARGPVLDQPSVVEVLRARRDVTAVLDVTDPEPPVEGDPLLQLPNVLVTSHIAGSHGRDCQRLGAYMVDEFERHLLGLPLRWRITREQAASLA